MAERTGVREEEGLSSANDLESSKRERTISRARKRKGNRAAAQLFLITETRPDCHSSSRFFPQKLLTSQLLLA